MKKNQLCPYCDPVSNTPHHHLEKFEKLFSIPQNGKLKESKFRAKVSPISVRGFVFSLQGLKFLKPATVSTQDRRVELLAKAAKKNDMDMKMLSAFGQPTSLFVAERKQFELLPTWPVGQRLPIDFDNKVLFKLLMQKHHIPAPKGKVFSSTKKAIQYVKNNLNFPVVVKPASGSLSMHVTTNIKNEPELVEAIRIAKIVSRSFLVEEYIPGNVYRLLCLDGQLVAAGLRQPPTVVGDGKSTILQLIKQKNVQQKKTGRWEVPITAGLEQTLENQNSNLKSIPNKNQEVLLFNKVILASGAVVEDVTPDVHTSFVALAEKAARTCDLPVIGFDLIVKDISKSAKAQKFGFIEANTMPFFDMHANAEKIAEQIWEIAHKKRT